MDQAATPDASEGNDSDVDIVMDLMARRDVKKNEKFANLAFKKTRRLRSPIVSERKSNLEDGTIEKAIE